MLLLVRNFRFFGFVVAQLLVFASVPVLANPVFDSPEGPPYYSLPPNFANPWIEGQTIDSVVQQYEAANASNPDSLPASCLVPLVPPPSPSPYGGYVTDGDGMGDITAMIFEGQERDAPCNQGNWWVGIGGTVFCPAGDLLVSSGDSPSGAVCVVFSQYELSITPKSPVIPYGSGVNDEHHVLTRSQLKLLVTKNNQPAPNISASIQSDRGTKDQITVFNPTNSEGIAKGYVGTWDQPGNSVLTSASSTIATAESAQISWLPARYKGLFKVTCYRVALESKDTTGPMVKIPGLPGRHHEYFLSDTNMQGSGEPLQLGPQGQKYIHYVKRFHKHMYENCPRTASTHCATKGKTVAVGLKIIPMSPRNSIFSQISIDDGIGDRTAEDTGGRINAYDIDLFGGRTAAAYPFCKNFGVQWHFVKFLSY